MSTVLEIRLLAGRGLRHIPRIPEKAVGAVLLPLVFVLLFAYVFGSAMSIGAGNYREFLVAGLYTRHLLTTHPQPPTDPAEASRLGARVPRTLPEVLELDLAAHAFLRRYAVHAVDALRGTGSAAPAASGPPDVGETPISVSTLNVSWPLLK